MRQPFSARKLIGAGAAVVVLGGAAIGVSVVQAQTAPATGQNQQQNLREKYVAALANRLHIDVNVLKQAMTDARADAGLPAQGQRPNGQAGTGSRGFGGGPGMRGFLGAEIDALVPVLKEPDRQTLLNDLAGKTLAELGTVKQVSNEAIVKAIVDTANARINQLASERNLPADRVAQMQQRISERVPEFVTTHRFPARGSGPRS